MYDTAPGIFSNIIDTRPVMRSGSAWPLPLYGTCSRSMPAIDLKSSADMCVEDPAPDDAKVSFPGAAFAAAMRSPTLFSGESAGTIRTLVMDAM